MARKGGLGKGLKELFNEEEESVPKEETGAETMVKLSLIEPNRGQPRKDFNDELLKELSGSIKQYGVLQPLLVKKNGQFYEIIAGERRWRAAKMAGLKEVPVLIREYTRQETMEIALIENVQRADLNPIEEAMAYQQLIQEFGLTQEDVAQRVSKSRTAVTNSMRLLKLDDRVREMLVDGLISTGHARALLAIEDGDMQYEAAGRVVKGNLSVRETEKLVKGFGKAPKKKEDKPEDRSLDYVYENLEERMKTSMGTKVIINKKDKNKGRIEIEYYSQAELERIVELIESVRN